MKNKYLDDLSKLLNDYNMDQSEREDIVNDYSNMYDSWTDKGLVDEEVEKKLGHPRSIIRDLTEGFKKVERPLPGSEKITALSPFVTTIIFLILGFGFNLWHPGWLVFLLIPVTAIVMSMGKTKEDHMSTALSPFVATTIFLILGFQYGLWHPGWMVFIIIPILALWNSRFTMSNLNLLTALSPFISVLIYMTLGTYGYWSEGWVVFLLIPMLGILNYPNKKITFLWILLAFLGIGGYLYAGQTYENEWSLELLSFVPLIILTLFINDYGDMGKISKEYKIVVAASIAAFLLVGYFLSAWVVSWLFFLAIPVYSIYIEAEGKAKAVALSPFIAITIFMLVGYYADLWHLSWIIFIIIPMTAIAKNA